MARPGLGPASTRLHYARVEKLKIEKLEVLIQEDISFGYIGTQAKFQNPRTLTHPWRKLKNTPTYISARGEKRVGHQQFFPKGATPSLYPPKTQCRVSKS